ncbi:MAG: glycoside hydrolase family 2 TIM barrel-domain containing protein [Faecalimonas sp.]|nr:glycoside hydrolase family 2 TIM barrel-domain containing protein [Faecalimonas sp.]
MRLKDALANIHKEHADDTLIHLTTVWGEKLDKENIWQEYPRPQLQREHFQMLHGEWDYAIVPQSEEYSFESQGKILVPFSPEAYLSGVGRQLQPNEYIWYQRALTFTKEECQRKEKKERCILHFDAVDQQTVVYVNDIEVAKHYGGYLPFEVDITEYISDAPCTLKVGVQDDSDTSYHTRGKQTLKRGGMFYTAQSGIWQSVWYEWVPENYVRKLKITPDYDSACVKIQIDSTTRFDTLQINLEDKEAQYEVLEVSEDGKQQLVLKFTDGKFKSWSPEEPYLYDFTLKADSDEIHGYFAMRAFSVEKDEQGVPRFCLNHKPYFLNGLLDQGYWPDGLMTAPCDEAFIYDIELAKKTGFNMIRKHIKIEPLRWYYHCDRLGMIVWQDMVNGGTTYNMMWACYMPTGLPFLGRVIKDNLYGIFARKSEEGRRLWEEECKGTVEHLYNVPSISTWVPFNEAWGQFDAARVAEDVKSQDPTRTVDHASGWFDQKAGDFNSVHNYFRKLKVEKDEKRAFVISEYGGYACHISGHSSVERIFGYKKFDTLGDLSNAYHELYEGQVLPLIEKGLSGVVYTQLSDVEEEVNGLVTYDRKVVKIK